MGDSFSFVTVDWGKHQKAVAKQARHICASRTAQYLSVSKEEATWNTYWSTSVHERPLMVEWADESPIRGSIRQKVSHFYIPLKSRTMVRKKINYIVALKRTSYKCRKEMWMKDKKYYMHFIISIKRKESEEIRLLPCSPFNWVLKDFEVSQIFLFAYFSSDCKWLMNL